MKKIFIFSIFLPIICLADPASDFSEKCASCHGISGEGRAGFSPKLAGQYWQYLRDQSLDIKSGERSNGNSALMKPIFKRMTEKEIIKLMKYIQGMDK